jgi:hypothetical protein
MSDRAQLERMIDEALRELGLDCRPFTLFAPQDQAHLWCVDFSDHAAPQFERTFQVCVEWMDESTYDSVKAELKSKLASRVSS